MSVRQVLEFTCDLCKKVNLIQGYGLPKGWIYFHEMLPGFRKGPIRHRCESAECVAKQPTKDYIPKP